MGKDYHKILGVSKNATVEEIKKAFRKLAMLFHPDRNQDPKATERFKEIGEAYAVLSGKEKAPVDALRSRDAGNWRRRTSGENSVFDWASEVMRIWQELEDEEFNNMYR